MTYAVLSINFFDYLEKVTCLASFDNEEKANEYCEKLKNDRDSIHQQRIDYVSKFVDGIVLPETDYHGWLKFLEQFHPFGKSYVFPKDFKESLKSHLISSWGDAAKLEGFNPPKLSDPNEYFAVVEIKECESLT